jgi:hypothetical protein
MRKELFLAMWLARKEYRPQNYAAYVDSGIRGVILRGDFGRIWAR